MRIWDLGREKLIHGHRSSERHLKVLSEVPRNAEPGPLDYLAVYQELRFPDGVLHEAVRLLHAIKEVSSRNLLLAAVSRVSVFASAFLSFGYRLRYRIRNRRLTMRTVRRLRRHHFSSARRGGA